MTPRVEQEEVRRALKLAIERIGTIDEESLSAIAQSFSIRTVSKGEFLLEPHNEAQFIFLVMRGWLREYFLREDGVERVKAFVLPGDFSGSLADLLASESSESYIVAGEQATVACLAYKEFVSLANSSPSWKDFQLDVLSFVVRAKARRERELLTLDAAERYEALRQQRPDICDVVPQKYIARYLGVTEVHLSRIRRSK